MRDDPFEGWLDAQRAARSLMAAGRRRYRYAQGLLGMPYQATNYVQSTLASPMTNASTTATLVSVAGLPTPTAFFRMIIKDPAPATTYEIVEVASVNAGTGVVTFTTPFASGRGLEGTTAIAHPAGAFVSNDITAGMLSLMFPQGVLPGGLTVLQTTNQTGITTQVDVTGMTVTVTVGTNRRIMVSAYALCASSVLDDVFRLVLVEAAGIGQLAADERTARPTGTTPAVMPITILNPTAGSHTYKVQAVRVGTGTMTVFQNAANPAFIVAEDIGSSV